MQEISWTNTYSEKHLENSFNNVNTVRALKHLLASYPCFLTCNVPLSQGHSHNWSFYWRASVLNKIKATWTETYRHELEFQSCLLCLPAREEPALPNITRDIWWLMDTLQSSFPVRRAGEGPAVTPLEMHLPDSPLIFAAMCCLSACSWSLPGLYHCPGVSGFPWVPFA